MIGVIEICGVINSLSLPTYLRSIFGGRYLASFFPPCCDDKYLAASSSGGMRVERVLVPSSMSILLCRMVQVELTTNSLPTHYQLTTAHYFSLPTHYQFTTNSLLVTYVHTRYIHSTCVLRVMKLGKIRAPDCRMGPAV